MVHLYLTYILRPGLDRMEAIIFQQLFSPCIKEAIWKGVKNYGIFQRKNGQNNIIVFPAKLEYNTLE